METQDKQILIDQLNERVKLMMHELFYYIIKTKSKNINDILKSFNENDTYNRTFFKLITGEEAEFFEAAVKFNMINPYRVDLFIYGLWHEWHYIESHKHDEDYNELIKRLQKHWNHVKL